ncbi:MAG: four helix bundle protein [Acidobacteriota bacterium]
MGARDHHELVCWQLANEARAIVLEQTRGRRFDGHAWLRSQLQESASSACANIAEAFGRYAPKDFARFLRISLSSANELIDHLETATKLGLINADVAETCASFARRSRGASTKLILYLTQSNHQ